jgi:carboxyl-terminal processing protease
VQTVDRRRISRSLEDEDEKIYYKGPLAVFISKYSASASEIVAGAIQDYGRGIILGDEHSFGKATVQVIEEISGTKGRASDGAIKVTQSKFYRPSGKSNQVTGVISDVVIPSVLAAGTIGEREHPFALDADRIRPATNFSASGDLTSVIPLLRDRSRERIAASKEFAELAERINKLREQEERAVVSLKARIAEKSAEESKSKSDGERSGESGLQDQAVDPKDFALLEAGRVLLDKVDLGIKATASGAKTRP